MKIKKQITNGFDLKTKHGLRSSISQTILLAIMIATVVAASTLVIWPMLTI